MSIYAINKMLMQLNYIFIYNYDPDLQIVSFEYL